VLAIDGEGVRVAGAKSPGGAMVPIAWVQTGLDLLEERGEVTIDAETLGHRSDFVGAVILSLPDVERVESTPPKARRST
jgi:hypothetical protein